MRAPVIDIGACTLCMGCVEVCPAVFRQNDAGYIEVIEMEIYPQEAVDEEDGDAPLVRLSFEHIGFCQSPVAELIEDLAAGFLCCSRVD